MRVGFDASPLHRPFPAGIVRVVEGALAALEARAKLDVVRLFPEADEDLSRWRHKRLPQLVRSEQLAGVHSFLSAYPRRGPGRRVQTVHELPWKHGVKENADWKHRFWATLGARRADAVVTATEFVARDLGLKPASSGGKLFVVPWAVGPEFAEEPPPGVVDEVLFARYRIPERSLCLCLGATRPKKNLAAVLRGVHALHAGGGPKLHVLISGGDSAQLRRDLGLASQLGLSSFVSTPGEIEAQDLPGLLRLATVVPILSHSEGFGLPVLEALASGTPVLVAAKSAQSEVAGEAGIAVDPADPESVADGLGRAVREREDLRYVLPERARAFTWERTAAGIESIWLRWAQQ